MTLPNKICVLQPYSTQGPSSSHLFRRVLGHNEGELKISRSTPGSYCSRLSSRAARPLFKSYLSAKLDTALKRQSLSHQVSADSLRKMGIFADRARDLRRFLPQLRQTGSLETKANARKARIPAHSCVSRNAGRNGGMPGWRRSAHRTRLYLNSLQTGNFTGKITISGLKATISKQETTVPQRLFKKFPKPTIRELFQTIREFRPDNRDLLQQICRDRFSHAVYGLARPARVRCTPESRHRIGRSSRLLCANIGSREIEKGAGGDALLRLYFVNGPQKRNYYLCNDIRTTPKGASVRLT
jgi:hypothetical protein